MSGIFCVQRTRILTCLILVISMLIGALAGGSPSDPPETAEGDPVLIALPSGDSLVSVPVSPDLRIKSGEDALRALESLKDAVGFEHTDEFLPLEPVSAGAVRVFGFRQQVGGIPVEGGEVRLVTDASGTVIGLSGDYLDPSEADTGVILTVREACDAVFAEIPEADGVLPSGLVILDTGSGAQAAYKCFLSGPEGMKICYVSARDGEILLTGSGAQDELAVGSGRDLQGKQREFNISSTESGYLLEDPENRIRVFDQKEKPLLESYWFRASMEDPDYYEIHFVKNGKTEDFDEVVTDGGTAFVLLKNGREDEAHRYLVRMENGHAVIRDNGEVILRDPVLETVKTDKSGKAVLSVLENADRSFEDETAVSAMYALQNAVRFYREMPDGDGSGWKQIVLNVYLNAPDTNGKDNAAASSVSFLDGFWGAAVNIGPDNPVAPDAIGHEYTHAVLRRYTTLGGTGSYLYPEASALNEGLADIMGQCIQDVMEGTCDWDQNGRSLRDPLGTVNDDERVLMHYPAVYKGTGWYFKTSEHPAEDDGYNNVFAHHNMTVISHMGYKIATGDVENRESVDALGTALLARLIYSTFPQLGEKTDFSDYATILYRTAVSMYRGGELSAGHVRCVVRAMEEAGLYPEIQVGADGILDLRDLKGRDVGTCTVEIRTLLPLDNGTVVILSQEGYRLTQTAIGLRDLQLTLPEKGVSERGLFKVTVTEEETDGKQSFTFLVRSTKRYSSGTVTAPFVLDAPLLNNGGGFVSYWGKTYYWKYNKDSFWAEGTNGYFGTNQNTANELVCREAGTGEETVLYKGPGSGNIFISGDRIYTEIRLNSWHSFTLAGEDEIVLEAGTVLAAVPETGRVIFQTSGRKKNEILVVNADGTTDSVSTDRLYTDDGANFLTMDGSRVYYCSSSKPDQTHIVTGVFEADLGSGTPGTPKLLGTFTVEVDSGERSGYSAVKTDDGLYVACVLSAGTASIYRNGMLVRLSTDREEAPETVIAQNSEYELAYNGIRAVGSGQDTRILFAAKGSFSGSGESITSPTEGYVYSYRISDGLIEPSDLPLISDRQVSYANADSEGRYADICVYNAAGTDVRTIAGKALLQALEAGLDGLRKQEGYFLKAADAVGPYAYLEFWEVESFQDLGWRTGTRRKSAVVYEIDIEHQTAEILYQY